MLAITGGTGFVGGALITAAIASGHPVRALARRPQPDRAGVDWIPGTLDDPAALDALVAGSDAVIHVAGAVSAADRAGFAAANIAGTEAMLAAATRAGVGRFVHVSSLAARMPALSDYGWSKAEAEARVEATALDWVIVRPPGVYGPGDLEMRDLFRLARVGFVLSPPGRFSLIFVDDLAALLLVLATTPTSRVILEPDDGTPGGWAHGDYGRAIGAAIGKRVIPLRLPLRALHLAALLDRAWRGPNAKLTPDRARYLSHPDWTADPARRPPPSLWRPRVALPEGLAITARWYRDQGLL